MQPSLKSVIDSEDFASWLKELEEVKLQGYEATRKFIFASKHKPELQDEPYGWLDVPTITADKLLQGEFKRYKDLEASIEEQIDFQKNIKILYKEVCNPEREGYTYYIIETIFINE